MLHGRCCSIAQLPYLFQVTTRANPSNDLLVHYRLVLMMDRSAKLSLWLETFDMALFILSSLNSAAKKWADFLKKEHLISGCVPCWAWLRLKINLRCYIVEKSEINWFIFNFRNKLINVMAGASVDVFSLTVSCIVAIVTSKIFTCDDSISMQPIESEYWIWPNISAAV